MYMSIKECIEGIYYGSVTRFDDILFSAFSVLGYSRLWVYENSSRIIIKVIEITPSCKQCIYLIDEIPVFAVRQTTELNVEECRYNENIEVEFLIERE